MATHQFKFAVSDVDLTDEQLAEISQAISQAGSAALAKHTPSRAIDIQLGPNWWWRGVPPKDVASALEKFAQTQKKHIEIGG
jgi:hypothetical protein